MDAQYPEPEGDFAKELATVVGGLAFPKADALFGALGIAIRHFSTKARIDRALAFIHALIYRVRELEKREVVSQDRVEELAEAIQIACYRDVESFNDSKRERYLTVLARANHENVDELVAFIQDIERLTETDISAMKLLHEVFPQRWI